MRGTTNGKILVVSEMITPGAYLIDLARNFFPQFGMQYGEDFIFIEEYLIQGVRGRVSDLLNKEIPGCQGFSWLGSKITLKGNYVWMIGKNIFYLRG